MKYLSCFFLLVFTPLFSSANSDKIKLSPSGGFEVGDTAFSLVVPSNDKTDSVAVKKIDEASFEFSSDAGKFVCTVSQKKNKLL